MTTKKTVEAYTLADFCQLTQDLILDGWKFDLESNEGFPTSFGSFFSATLRKQAEVIQAVTDRVVAVVDTTNQIVQGALEETAEVVDTDATASTKKRSKAA